MWQSLRRVGAAIAAALLRIHIESTSVESDTQASKLSERMLPEQRRGTLCVMTVSSKGLTSMQQATG